MTRRPRLRVARLRGADEQGSEIVFCASFFAFSCAFRSFSLRARICFTAWRNSSSFIAACAPIMMSVRIAARRA